MDTGKLRIEAALESDIPLLLAFIKELAAYEELLDHASVTEDRLRKTLFGNHACAHAVIA